MRPRRLRRLGGFDYTGPFRYSLTLCAFERQALFRDATLIDVLLLQILRAAESTGFEIMAYCFMPDHLHLVIQGTAVSSALPVFLQRAKQLSGYYGKRATGRTIWPAGYYERVLRETDDTTSVIAYVLANPVRAQLVTCPGDYPFSGSGVCSLGDLLDFVQERLGQDRATDPNRDLDRLDRPS